LVYKNVPVGPVGGDRQAKLIVSSVAISTMENYRPRGPGWPQMAPSRLKAGGDNCAVLKTGLTGVCN